MACGVLRQRRCCTCSYHSLSPPPDTDLHTFLLHPPSRRARRTMTSRDSTGMCLVHVYCCTRCSSLLLRHFSSPTRTPSLCPFPPYLFSQTDQAHEGWQAHVRRDRRLHCQAVSETAPVPPLTYIVSRQIYCLCTRPVGTCHPRDPLAMLISDLAQAACCIHPSCSARC